MIFKKLFKKKSETEKSYPNSDVLHMWEDDYLMIEILPIENVDFVKAETTRVEKFGKENQTEFGYEDITEVREKPFKTIDKQIPIELITNIFSDTNLERVKRIVMQGVGLIENENRSIRFGSNKFAIVFDKNDENVKNIWITGKSNNEQDKIELQKGLLELLERVKLVGVNWYQSKYYDLSNKEQLTSFINECC